MYEKKIEKFQDRLDREHIRGTVYKHYVGTREIVAVEVNGDWKHDHMATDYTAKVFGLTRLAEELIHEDGSDWYESVHYYA